nr:MAG TPA_asm: hypothetical protein [Caudoviricetes sp.]
MTTIHNRRIYFGRQVVFDHMAGRLALQGGVPLL